MAFFSNFKASALELKSLRCLTVTALLIAMDVALKYFTISLTDSLKISFAFIAIASIGMLFGPVVAGLAGIVTDVVGFLFNPSGAFNPLFTIVEMTGGIVYGIFLYKLSPVKLDFKNIKNNTKFNLIQAARIVIGKAAVVVICNLVMTPVALVLSGYVAIDALPASMLARVVKNAIQLPVDCVLLLVLLFPILFAYKSVFKSKAAV